jgi:hypothetical protein
MPDPSIIFAYTVAGLAGLAVLAVLAYVIVWAIYGIRRTIANHRNLTASARTKVPPFDPSTRYWPEHSAVTVVDGVPLVDSIVPPPAS